MTVNKDDMLLVTKNTRGNHHVFINVTRLQQLIWSEGHKVEKDPFIVLLGRLPASQFVTGAMFDKAVSASLRVQGSKSQAKEGSSKRSSPLAEEGSVEPSEKRVEVKSGSEMKTASEVKKGVSETTSASQEMKSDPAQDVNNASTPHIKNEPATHSAQPLSVKRELPTPPEPDETVLVPIMFNSTPKLAKEPWVFLGSDTQPSIHTFADYVRFFPSLQPSTAAPFIDHVARSNTVKFTKKDASTVVRGVG